MSSEFWIALFATIPATIAAIGALVVSLMNARAAAKAAVKVEEIRHATNSMKDQLVAGAFREGVAEGGGQAKRPSDPQPASEHRPASTSQSLGDNVRETLADVKEVKKDVKDLKDDK